jgi:leader peptidase (prepilin peptidase) / N-methyltransferase
MSATGPSTTSDSLMTPTTIAMLCALAFGIVAALVLLPMARMIPARLERQWAGELEAYALTKRDTTEPTIYSYTLPHKAIVVVVAMLLGLVVITTYGSTAAGAAYALYYFSLLLLVAINVKHALLPDSIVFTTLWAGLLYYAYAGGVADHVYGAAAGYLVPFFVSLMFKLTTGKDVIGYGDLKALAMAGAWFGIAAMPVIIGTFVAGFIVWAILLHVLGHKSQGSVSTGPAHLLASLAVTLGVTVF